MNNVVNKKRNSIQDKENIVKTPSRKDKLANIHWALDADPVDIAGLRKMATSHGGLLTDELRRKAWPKLLNVNVFETTLSAKQDLTSHRDYNQVVLDVNRSLRRFPPGMRDEQREVLQDQLTDVIVTVLANHPQLHYYQGYHDICVTFLLVVGQDLTLALIDKLSTHHLRDFMDSTMHRTTHMLNYLIPIIDKAHPQLAEFIERSEAGNIFALPWLITWFGHVLNDFRSVVRLYDFFLACHPLMPVYLAASVVLFRAQEVLAGECEMTHVHSLLSKIPQNLPFEDLISKAGQLYIRFPPELIASHVKLRYKSPSITKFSNLEKTAKGQRPDTVLRRRRQQNSDTRAAAVSEAVDQKPSAAAKVAVWFLTATLATALYFVLNTAHDLT